MELINELNEILYDKNIFNMKFTMLTNGDLEFYYLDEVEKFGWKLQIFHSEDKVDDDLIDAYEEKRLNYRQLIIEQIKRNLVTIIRDIQTISMSLP